MPKYALRNKCSVVTLPGNNSKNPPKYVNRVFILGNLGMRRYMNRILVVDDEPDINMLLMIILEDAGFKVDLYEDPIRALLNFRPGLYDLAILDIIMESTLTGTFSHKWGCKGRSPLRGTGCSRSFPLSKLAEGPLA